MANMTVAMTLTLGDKASPDIRTFIGLLETLEKAVMSASGKIAAFAEGIAGIATASKTAAGGVRETADAAATLSGALTGVNTRLSNAVTRLGELTAEAGTAAASMLNLGHASAEANIGNTFAGAGAGVRGVTGEVNTLADSIKGMAALWAAFQIEKGLKTAIGDAAEFERTENRMRNLNMPASETALINKAVMETGAAFPQFDRNKLLEMAIDLRNATGSAHEAAAGLKGFAEAIFAINLSLPTGQKLSQQDTLSFAKLLEGRGVTMDAARMEAEIDTVTKIVAATQGRVNPANLFGNLTYAKGGLGQTMDEDAFKTFAAMIEQDTMAGGTGGRVGTMLTSFVNSITKANAITTKNREEWLKLGLVDPGKVNINENTNRVTSIQAGAIAGTDIVGKNFKRWVDEFLRPALIAQGVDMSDLSAIKGKTDVLFPNRNAAEAAFQLLARKELIEKDVANISQAAGKQEQVENGAKLATAAFERFKVAITNLAIAIGTTLLPVLTPLIQDIANILTKFAGFTTAHPMFGFMLGVTAAFGTLSAAIFGMQKLFGPIAGLFGGVAAEAGSMGTILATTGEGIAIASAFMLRSMLRLVPVVGLILLAWDFAPIIGNLEVGGHTIAAWAEAISNKVLNYFTDSWKQLTLWASQTSFDVSGFLLAMFPIVGLAVKAAEFIGQLEVFGKPIKAWASDLSDYVAGKLNGMLSAIGKVAEAAVFGKPIVGGEVSGGFGPEYQMGGTTGGFAEENIDPHKAERDRNAAAAAALLGRKKEKKGRFANYNEAADAAAQEYKLDEDALRNTLKIEDALYKAHQMSIEDYYARRNILSQLATDKEIADLERKKAALLGAKEVDQHAVKAVDTQIAEAQSRLATRLEENKIKEQTDINALKQKELGIDTLILEAEGKGREVKIANTLKKLQEDRAAFLLNPSAVSPGAVGKLDTATSITVLEREYERTADKIKLIQAQTKAGEADITNAVKAGSKTQFDAENDVYNLRQKEALEIQDLLALLQQFMAASGAPEEVQAAIMAKIAGNASAAKGALTELTPLAKEFHAVMESAFTSFYANILKGGMSAKSILQNLGSSFKQGVDNIVSKHLGDATVKMISTSAQSGWIGDMLGSMGGVGESIRGLLGGLGGGKKGDSPSNPLYVSNVNPIGALFGGTATGATGGSGSGGGILPMIGDAIKYFGGSGGGAVGATSFAGGAASAEAETFFASMATLAVGTDRVPQDMLAMIHKDEMVIPAASANALRSGAGALPMHVTNNFNIPAPTTRETQMQVATNVQIGLNRAAARNL